MPRKRKCPQCDGLGFGFSFSKDSAGEMGCHVCHGEGKVDVETYHRFKLAKEKLKKPEHVR